MKMRSSAARRRKRRVHQSVLRWYRRYARPLPWRSTRDPYQILVSEIMLQQTQVSRVLEKYPLFLRQFPTLKRLAAASAADVIRAWQGLGYNNRALNLQRLARIVVAEHRGRLPHSPDELKALPGIGPYTAHAVACFAFGAPVATVDTNIRRVLSRVFPSVYHSDIWSIAQHVLPRRTAYDWNQGLMELGALICTARNPSCHGCPIRSSCPSANRVEAARRYKIREKTRKNLPNRIYRGRIVEVLRSSHRPVSLKKVLRRAIPDFSDQEQKWLIRLLEALERDGVVKIRKQNQDLFLSLPD